MGDLDLGTLRASVELDLKQFEQQFGQIEHTLRKLGALKVQDPKIGLNTDGLTIGVTKADATLKRLAATKTEAKIVADGTQAATETTKVTGVLNRLASTTTTTSVDAKIDGAIGGLTKVTGAAQKLNHLSAEVSVSAETSGVNANLEGVEADIKALDGQSAEVHVGAETSDVDANLDKVGAKLRVLDGTKAKVTVTADTTQAVAATIKVDEALTRLSSSATTTKIDADINDAVKKITKIKDAGEALDREEFGPRIDVEIERAQARIDDIRLELNLLDRMDPSAQVTADTQKANADLEATEARLRALQGARAEMEVTADTSGISDKIGNALQAATSLAQGGGGAVGDSIVGGITDGLGSLAGKSGPIVGAVLGAIAAIIAIHPGIKIAEAIMEDTGSQMRGGFEAATGLDSATAAKWGRAVGESYANNFGESIESNMDAAKVALQSGLLGGDATSTEITSVVNGLTTVSDILGEEVPAVTKAAAQAIRTGLVKNTDEAFDLFVRANQKGINVSEDLLDTINEYGTQFRKVGLEGPAAMGRISQAVKAGARDSDLAADAIKEFSIRAIDGSELSAQAYERLGLSAKQMTADVAAGGPTASAALGQVLDKLREVEDPAQRAEIAVGLFGTQAEDLGEALYAMDLSTAVDEFGAVEGAASRAMDSLASNNAARIEGAKRSIEMAATSTKDAMAVAFAPLIEDVAGWVTSHRAEITSFLLTIGEYALKGAVGMVELGATGLRTASKVASGAGSMANSVFGFVDGMLAGIEKVAKLIPGMSGKIADAREGLNAVRETTVGFFEKTSSAANTAADVMDTKVSPALQQMLANYGGVKEGAVATAELADATTITANKVQDLATAVEAGTVKIEKFDGVLDGTTQAEKDLANHAQLVSDALDAELAAAARNGEGQEELVGRVNATRDAFVAQAQAAGLTAEQANALADKYKLLPSQVTTLIKADTSTATQQLETFISRHNGRSVSITINTKTGSQVAGSIGAMKFQADGGVLDYFADGGVRESHVAQIAPAGAWRMWAEPETGGEAYIPLAAGKRGRSEDILAAVAERFGGAYVPNMTAYASGGVNAISRPAYAQRTGGRKSNTVDATRSAAATISAFATDAMTRDIEMTKTWGTLTKHVNGLSMSLMSSAGDLKLADVMDRITDGYAVVDHLIDEVEALSQAVNTAVSGLEGRLSGVEAGVAQAMAAAQAAQFATPAATAPKTATTVAKPAAALTSTRTTVPAALSSIAKTTPVATKTTPAALSSIARSSTPASLTSIATSSATKSTPASLSSIARSTPSSLSSIMKRASGGQIPGTPPANSKLDNLLAKTEHGQPIAVQSGEYIQQKKAVDYYGLAFMSAINELRVPRDALANLPGLALGGPVGGSELTQVWGALNQHLDGFGSLSSADELELADLMDRITDGYAVVDKLIDQLGELTQVVNSAVSGLEGRIASVESGVAQAVATATAAATSSAPAATAAKTSAPAALTSIAKTTPAVLTSSRSTVPAALSSIATSTKSTPAALTSIARSTIPASLSSIARSTAPSSLSSIMKRASGGVIPGTPPADSRIDNLLAMTENGKPVAVQSGEYIQQKKAVDYYGTALMHAINEQKVPREVFATIPGLAVGGQIAGRLAPSPQPYAPTRAATSTVTRQERSTRIDIGQIVTGARAQDVVAELRWRERVNAP